MVLFCSLFYVIFSLFSVLCLCFCSLFSALCSLLSALSSLHLAFCIWLFPYYYLFSIFHSSFSILGSQLSCSVLCSLSFPPRISLSFLSSLCFMFFFLSALRSLIFALYSLFSILYSLFSILYSLFSILYSIFSILVFFM